MLLLNLNQVVPIARIVDEVWAEAAPQTVRDQVHANISRLRHLLRQPKAEIRTHEAGYVLRSDLAEFDVAVFDHHVRDGQRLLADGDPAAAAGRLDAALALWRGTPFGGVDQRVTAPEVARLCELRLGAVRARTDAYLSLGRGPETLAELAAAIAEHPLHEDLRRMLMLAQYQAGGRAEALAAYRDGCRILREELGLDPGPELVALHDAILRDDPALHGVRRRPVAIVAPSPVLTGTPAQLPPADGYFTGRARQLGWLDDLVPKSRTREQGRPPADAPQRSAGEPGIALISGPAGTGKTALAVQWAHRVRSGFPDGQLYLDLEEEGWTPAEALARLLHDLGVPVRHQPEEDRAKKRVYRTVTADRACLVLLENPPSSQHVLTLIPASTRSTVIVTSRTWLAALATHHSVRSLHLDYLDHE